VLVVLSDPSCCADLAQHRDIVFVLPRPDAERRSPHNLMDIPRRKMAVVPPSKPRSIATSPNTTTGPSLSSGPPTQTASSPRSPEGIKRLRQTTFCFQLKTFLVLPESAVRAYCWVHSNRFTKNLARVGFEHVCGPFLLPTEMGIKLQLLCGDCLSSDVISHFI
jgi:hypothetical protein